MRNILLAALIAQLPGCFFVYIPGSVLQAIGDGLSGQEGQYCAVESAKVGDRLPVPSGAIGTIKKLEGFSSRCKDTTPIRVVVTFD